MHDCSIAEIITPTELTLSKLNINISCTVYNGEKTSKNDIIPN